jgi:hypothetical protein
VQEAGELRGQLTELAMTIIGDIKPVRNTNAPVARNVDDICSGVFKPTTWDCGLDQPVSEGAVF